MDKCVKTMKILEEEDEEFWQGLVTKVSDTQLSFF